MFILVTWILTGLWWSPRQEENFLPQVSGPCLVEIQGCSQLVTPFSIPKKNRDEQIGIKTLAEIGIIAPYLCSSTPRHLPSPSPVRCESFFRWSASERPAGGIAKGWSWSSSLLPQQPQTQRLPGWIVRPKIGSVDSHGKLVLLTRGAQAHPAEQVRAAKLITYH